MTVEEETLFAVEPLVQRSAVLSGDGVYRYRLGRRWSSSPTMCWVMLNPSTADAFTDDQTIRRCMFYADRSGCGAIDVVNLYAYRATQPRDLVAAAASGVDVVGADNVEHVSDAVNNARLVVVGWGANAARTPPTPVHTYLGNQRRPLYCLGITGAGFPRHPSRLGNDTPIVPYET